METAEPRRIPALDGMRGLAVLCVIVAHTLPQDQGLGRFVHFGRLGVDLFFALSGYLITGILLGARDRIREGRSSWPRAMRTFYARRALRILPAYCLTVLICLLVGYAPVRDHLVWILTYTVNFGQALFAVPFGWADHLWSLSVEEQFYLVWPTLLLALPPRSVRTALLSVAGAVLVMNAAVAFSGASFLLPLRLPFLGSFLPILAGALLAEGEWSAEKTHRPIRRAFRALFLPVGLPLFLLTQWLGSRPGARDSSLYLSLVDLAFALLSLAMLACFVSPESDASMLSRIFRWRPLRWVGVLSYGVYLAHRLLEPSVEGALARAGIFSPGAYLLALTVVSVGAAAASWYAYERPIQRLKRFFPYAQRDPRSRSHSNLE